MTDESTQFDYLLNAFELASQADQPSEHGYAEKRRALYAHVRQLEAAAASPRPAPAGAPASETVKKYTDLRAKAEYFEDGEYIILAAGGFVGGTVSKSDGQIIERWLNDGGALPELAHRINKLFADSGARPAAGADAGDWSEPAERAAFDALIEAITNAYDTVSDGDGVEMEVAVAALKLRDVARLFHERRSAPATLHHGDSK